MEQHSSRMTVVVVDRHALFRRGVVALLRDARPGWDCSDADSLASIRELLESETPILVLADLGCPEFTDPDGLANLIAEYPQHLIVGVSDQGDRCRILDCLTAGGRGYVLRSTDTSQFIRAMDTIMGGGVFAPATLTTPTRRPEQIVEQARDAALLDVLTERQRAVFNLLAEGCATKTIARRLDLAVGTVKVHLAAIYRTLGASSRLEALAKAHRAHATV